MSFRAAAEMNIIVLEAVGLLVGAVALQPGTVRMSLSSVPDYYSDFFHPRASDIPYASAFALARKSGSANPNEFSELRFLLRDRADSIVLTVCERQGTEEEFISRALTPFGFRNCVDDLNFRQRICEQYPLYENAHEKHESVKAFKNSLSLQDQRNVDTLTALRDVAIFAVHHANIWSASEVLLDRRWLDLTKTPGRYNNTLNRCIGTIKRSLKRLHGIPSHRSQLYDERDREVWSLKQTHRQLSFRQVGQQFSISAGAAKEAYKRQAMREMRRLKTLRRTAAALYHYYSADDCTLSSLAKQLATSDTPLAEPQTLNSLARSLEPDRISDNEYVWRSLSSFRFFELVRDENFRSFIYRYASHLARAADQYDSVLDLLHTIPTFGGYLSLLEDMRLRILIGMVVSNVWSAYMTLLDAHWLDLAQTPQQYKRAMDQRLRSIKASLKYLHGVVTHRAALYAQRDRELWLKKRRDPAATWRQLGETFNLSTQGARDAYKRQSHRELLRLKILAQTSLGMYNFYEGHEAEAFGLLGIDIGRLRLRSLVSVS